MGSRCNYLSLPPSIQRTKKVVGKDLETAVPRTCHDVSWSRRLGLNAQVHAGRPVGGALRWRDLLRVIVEGGIRRGVVIRDNHLRGRNRAARWSALQVTCSHRLTTVAI